ncbi:phage head-tail connector protein [Clostridium oceanicum]
MDINMLLEKIKRRSNVSINQKDELLNDFIEETQLEISEYINSNEIPKVLESVLIDIVIIKLNRLGNEGLLSESFSGISQTYIDDLPKYILKKLRRNRKLPR